MSTATLSAYEQAHSSLFDRSASTPSSKALVKYRLDPVGFFVNILRIPEYRIRWSLNRGYERHKWDGTPDPLVVLLNALRDGKDASAEAGTGTQKSYTVGGAVLWFISCWEGAGAFTFAPNEDQLRNFMWKEIRALWGAFSVHFPQAVLLDLEIRMRGGQDNTWGAIGVTVKPRRGEKVSIGAQGMHRAHMLLVYEETPGLEYPVIDAGINTSTGAHNLRVAVGNPDSKFDSLHLFGHTRLGQPLPNVVNVRISALDHPNVVLNDPDIVPGAVSVKSVELRREQYGEEDPVFQSRVRGISPSQDPRALIKMEWIVAAQERFKNPAERKILEAVGHGRESLGVDASNSEDGDHAAIARGKGAVCREVPSFPCDNSNNLGYDVFLEMQERRIDDAHVGVDGIGVGAGTVNELRGRNRWIQSLIGGASPIGSMDQEDWDNLRSQMMWTLREDLRKDMIALPDDPDLVVELLVATWKTQNGKIRVEKKEEIQKRTPRGRSPNKADALMYWNFVRPRDPVVSERPKNNAKTIAERVFEELKSLDTVTPKKQFFVLRQ